MERDQVIVGPMISRIRAGCPLLQGRVAGAADFAKGLREYNATMGLPAAYVIPRGQDVGPNRQMVGLWQSIQKIMAIVVEFSATADRRGQDPTMHYDEIETCLFGAVLMWKPDECRSANGFYFVGGNFLDLDRARSFYEWQFAIDWQITDADAVPIWDLDPTYQPLCGIEVDIHKAPLDEHPTPAAVVVLDTDPDDMCEGQPP